MDGGNQSLPVGHVSSVLRLERNQFTVPINGILMPLVAVVTLVNNVLVLAVLLHRQMRSPTNALLAALAVSDTLTSLCPLPFFVCFYTLGRRYLDWVPYSWCFAYFCLTDYLPTVFHTVSIWLTTCLAVQRYACVCCSVNSEVRRRLCSMRGAVGVIGGVFAAAVASQACRLGELSFSPVTINSTVDGVTATTVHELTGCRYELAGWIARNETVYYSVYYWSRVVLIHVVPRLSNSVQIRVHLVRVRVQTVRVRVQVHCLYKYEYTKDNYFCLTDNLRVVLIHVVPCSALVLLNYILIRTMKTARHHRRHMSRSTTLAPSTQIVTVTETPETQYEMHRVSTASAAIVVGSSARQPASSAGTGGDSSTRATMMLIVVVGAFLLVEVPLCVKES